MKAHTDKKDETLVELTLLGDKTAYEELVLRHQRAVMGTAYKDDGEQILGGGRFAGCVCFGLDESFRASGRCKIRFMGLRICQKLRKDA